MITQDPSNRSKSRKTSASASDACAFIDLGSHKIACLISKGDSGAFGRGPKSQDVLGFSIVQAAGIGEGQIHDMPSAAGSLRNAIVSAEEQANVRVSTAVLTGSFKGLRCHAFNANLGAFDAGPAKSRRKTIFTAAYHDAARNRRHLSHVFSREPGDAVVQSPDDVEPDTAVISITLPLNIAIKMMRCCAQVHVHATEFIAAPIASGFISAEIDERLQGAILIEMGASTTGVAVFSDAVPVGVETFPFGGMNITRAIAETFNLSLSQAEQIKLRHATVFGGLIAHRDLPFHNELTGQPVSKVDLNRLVRKEAANQLTAVNERLKGKGYPLQGCAVILTGGASQLPGLAELTAEITGGTVRHGSFPAPAGLKSDPSMAALFGAFSFASQHQYRGEIALPSRRVSQASSYAARIGGWLRTSF